MSADFDSDGAEIDDDRVNRTFVLGLLVTLVSCFMFAICAPLGKLMYAGGWTPVPVTFVRLAGSALLLAVPMVIQMRGRWRMVWDARWYLLTYGVVCMSGVQLLFFLAVERMSPPIALLLEMTAPLMIVLWVWASTRFRPSTLTFIGIAAAGVGLVVILDPRGSSVDPLGVVFALSAAVCLAVFFLMSNQSSLEFPSVTLICIGMAIGAVVVAVIGGVGLLPADMSTADLDANGVTVPWWVGALALLLFTAGAYTTSVIGVRYIGSTVSSFVNLIEVPMSVVMAWILLGDLPMPVQAIGGLFVLAGVVFVKLGENRQERRRVIARTNVHPETSELHLVVEEEHREP